MATAAEDIRQTTGATNNTGTIAQIIGAVVDVHFPEQLPAILWILAGSIAMRGAGCVYNDIIDRDLDAQVARTAARPIPRFCAMPR